MKKIANIYTTNKKMIVGSMFNLCNDKTDIDDTLPTLIIGYDNAEDMIRNFSILKKDYPKQNLYWTFKKTEKREDNERDVEAFYKKAIEIYCSNIKYEYLDFINMPLSRIKNFLKYIKGNDEKYILFLKNFAFIYSKRYNMTWGLSLSLCEYLGISKRKCIGKLTENENTNVVKFDDLSDDIKKLTDNEIKWFLPLYVNFEKE